MWKPVFGNGTAVQFANQPIDLERPDPAWRQPRVLYVHHPSDPVGNATLEALWRRPEWTERPKGYDVPARAGWSPIVTGLQQVADLIAGFSAPSGYGHNYGIDFAAWAAVAPPTDGPRPTPPASSATSRTSRPASGRSAGPGRQLPDEPQAEAVDRAGGVAEHDHGDAAVAGDGGEAAEAVGPAVVPQQRTSGLG